MTERPPLIRPSNHAVIRYVEGIRDCAPDQARAELTRLLKAGTIHPDPPGWIVRGELTADAWSWLSVDGDLACPLLRQEPSGDMLAVTIYIRGSVSEEERQWRTQRKQYDRQSRSAARTSFAKRGRPRRETPFDNFAGNWSGAR